MTAFFTDLAEQIDGYEPGSFQRAYEAAGEVMRCPAQQPDAQAVSHRCIESQEPVKRCRSLSPKPVGARLQALISRRVA